MKKAAAFLLLLAVILLPLCACGDNNFDYGGYIGSLKGDPDCCGYSYTNGAAVYEIRQRGDDVRIDFKSYVQQKSDLSASRVGGRTVYSDGKSYFEDKKNVYPLSVTSDRAVVDWLYDEIKEYGDFTPTDSEDKKYDVLTAAKTEIIKTDEIDVACDKYEVFLPYRDGKNYVMTYYAFEDGGDVILKGAPEGLSTADGWTLDAEKSLLINEKTNESYTVVATLLESYKPTGQTKEQIKTAYVYIDKTTRAVYKIIIKYGGGADEYTLLYPDKITPLDTDGQSEMTDSEKEHAATMISLMILTL